jgi:IS30 family transposase
LLAEAAVARMKHLKVKVRDEEIEYVMSRLNNRPRVARDYCSPNELFMGLRGDLLTALGKY